MKRLVFLMVLLMFSSCSQIVENYWERKAEENYESPYRGTYTGYYSGGTQGTLKIVVSSKDLVEVTRTVNGSAIEETFSGGLTGGSFNGMKSPTTGFTLFGNLLYTPQGSFTGTWKFEDWNSGSWTLQKQ